MSRRRASVGGVEMEMQGYRSSWWRSLVCALAVILTGGLVLILLASRKDFKLNFLCEKCSLDRATKILIKDSFGQFQEEHVVEEADKNKPYRRYFYNKKIKYVWNDDSMHYCKLGPFDENVGCDQFHSVSNGLNSSSISHNQHIYGENFIKIEVLPVIKLIIEEVSNPFYFIQFYTVCIWMAQQYYDYSSLVLVGTLVTVGTSVWETRKQSRALREKCHVAGTIVVLRDGLEKSISTVELVPGDLVCIHPQEAHLLHCDAVLTQGTCSVDESMLTGESYPITKMPVPNDQMSTFDYGIHKRHVLFSGTKLIQGRPEGGNVYLKAVVIRTGYMTSKGELIRAILFPKPANLIFYSDLLKCALLFMLFGLGGLIYSLYFWITNGGTIAEIVLNSLDLFTVVVPPILPAALTATTSFAQRRLRKQNIFCLSSKCITMCGGLDVVCFDKTGTLTESDMDISGVLPVDKGQFPCSLLGACHLPTNGALFLSMTTCHSLITTANQLHGYSIDRKMFEATTWTLKDGPRGVNEEYGVETPFLVQDASAASQVAILKRYPFESTFKRMSVIVLAKGVPGYQVLVKGAPEIIASLCNDQSVPSDFEKVLQHYTAQGYRVLALASRKLDVNLSWEQINGMTRCEMEQNMQLLGLLVVQNQLKSQTLANIRILHEANINTVMVTGDNLQTAIKIAKDCEMIDSSQRVIQVEATAMAGGPNRLRVQYRDPLSRAQFISAKQVKDAKYCFAMDGPTFESLGVHNYALFEKIVHRTKVFARMAPQHKQYLVETLKKMGRQVGMVGDGCNDCGALRAADTGVSLSMADASVAAPFTSQETNIGCVPPLIREGRATLDAAFGTFQFAIGVCFICFCATMMLFSIATEPSDFQYFTWYIVIALTPFFTYGNTPPAKCLDPRRPLRRLWAFLPLFSFFSFILWQSAVLLAGWFYCYSQPWFVPYVFEPGRFPVNPSYEETTIFYLLCIGSIVSAIVFAPSPPYSQNIFKNRIFAVWSVIAVALNVCIMFISHDSFASWMNFKIAPEMKYNLVILAFGVGGGILCYCWEKFLIRRVLYQWAWPQLNTIRSARHDYQKIESEFSRNPDWFIADCQAIQISNE